MPAAVVVLAAILRLPALDSVPPPLNQDEASRGYDAWAILETGADRYGQRWPLFLESFGSGDYTAALSTYVTVPFVAILGPTVLAMRLPDALLGVATVLLVYVWLKQEAGATVAIVAAAILTLDPWHICLCRTAHESGMAPFFLAAAMLALGRSGLMPTGEARNPAQDKGPRRLSGDSPGTAPLSPGLREAATGSEAVCESSEARQTGRHQTIWAFAAGLMLALHAWVYPATRLFTPLFCIALVVVYGRSWRRYSSSGCGRGVMTAAMIGLILGALPMITTAVMHPERLAARAQATLISPKDVGLHHAASAFAGNFLAHYDPRYMFAQADEMSGASVPGVGLHLGVWAPVFVIGLIRIAAGSRRRSWWRFLLLWLVLYPIPAAVCEAWNPHPMRSVGGMLLFPVIGAVGGEWVLVRAAAVGRGWRRLIAGLGAAALAVNGLHFARAYYREFPLVCRPGYQTALVEAFRFLAPLAHDADFVLVTNYSNQPYIYALLYQPIHPRELATMEKVVAEGRFGFHHVLRVGKYYFPPRDDVDGTAGRFQELWDAVPPGATGLIVDIEGPGRPSPGQVLARFPVGDPRVPGQAYQVRRWQLPGAAPQLGSAGAVSMSAAWVARMLGGGGPLHTIGPLLIVRHALVFRWGEPAARWATPTHAGRFPRPATARKSGLEDPAYPL